MLILFCALHKYLAEAKVYTGRLADVHDLPVTVKDHDDGKHHDDEHIFIKRLC